jgi:hypothetical protein
MNHNKEFEYLVGKKISGVRYMTDQEANDFGFYKKPLVIVFEGGDFMIPVTDDECNDGGAALFFVRERNGYKETLIYTT